MSTKKLQILDYNVKQAENADTVDGKHASEFGSASDVSNLQTLVGDTAVSDQISAAIINKVDKVSGKDLSTNDYTTAEKNKLAGITESADSVSFTANATSGNKVGTITINGTVADMYSPVQTTVSGNAGSATKLATARTIDGVSFDGSANITHYGTCSTAAATAAKTVSVTNFTLATGARVYVKFSYTNTASSPTLNVNSTGAKNIRYGTSNITTDQLRANRVCEFVYDGSYYQIVGVHNVFTTNFDGLVPKSTGGTTGFLRADGTWAVPSYTTYSVASTSSDGLMSSSDKTKINSITTGTWTPTASNWTISTAKGTYMKIGTNVVISFYVTGTGNSTSATAPTTSSYYFKLSGLPFTPSTNSKFYGGGGHVQGAVVPSGYHFSGYTLESSSAVIYARAINDSTYAGDYVHVANGSATIYASGTIMYTSTS